MATFSGFCLRAFAASRLESAVKQVGGSGGDRDGGGGIRVGDAEVCAAADQAGRRGGIGMTAAAGTGAVAVPRDGGDRRERDAAGEAR